MTVKEFVDAYTELKNNSGDTERFIKEHIVTKYVPWAIKVADCTRMANTAMYITVDEKKQIKMYEPNRNLVQFLFDVTLVKRYTDIDIDLNDATNDYDALSSVYDLFGKVLVNIPSDERVIYRNTCDNCLKDVIERETNTTLFLKAQLPVILAKAVETAMAKYAKQK